MGEITRRDWEAMYQTIQGLKLRFDAILNTLGNGPTYLDATLERVFQMFEQLKGMVEKSNSVQESAITLLYGLKKKLDEAVQNGSDPAEIERISKSIGESADRLAAAVAANTVADTAAPDPAPASPVDVDNPAPVDPVTE